MLKHSKITVKELVDLFRWWYAPNGFHSGAGAFLHIVTDDGNLEDHHIHFCIEKGKEGLRALREGKAESIFFNETTTFFHFGIMFGELLLRAPYETRKQAYVAFWEGYHAHV